MAYLRGARAATNKVQLAVSPLGGIPGATAFHSSVLVNDEEFSFSDAGVSTAQGPASHRANSKPAQVIDLGKSARSGRELQAAIGSHFAPGTYDLLRKNCNSFSDAALFFLLGKRLDPQYRTLDRLGSTQPALVQAVSGGKYAPNPKAAGFDLEQVIADVDPEKAWRTPGHATGGARASSVEGVRLARLARFAAAPEHVEATSGSPSRPPVDTGRPTVDTLADDELLARQLQAEWQEPHPVREVQPAVAPAAASAATVPAAASSAGPPPLPAPAAAPPASSTSSLPASEAGRGPQALPGERPDAPLTEDERLVRQLQLEEDERLARQLTAEGGPQPGAGSGHHRAHHQGARQQDPGQQIAAGISSLLSAVSAGGRGSGSRGLFDPAPRGPGSAGGGASDQPTAARPDPAQQFVSSIMTGVEQFNTAWLRMTRQGDAQQRSSSNPFMTT